ncbi:MAG: PspC domain-containing protein [Bacteroidales bacterium]|jgi:phage shock protein PspC (stress-responsive transcriptional regulator)
MKKVIKVSINKMPFTLAEDAFNVLKVYLDHLHRYYAGKEGGSEIVDGIEERIAELLGERTGPGARVVSKADVDAVLDIMGPPEVIEEEGGDPSGDAFTGSPLPKAAKRLYRDVDHKVIGGVCSGLAAYFNIEVVLIRILFAVLFFVPSGIHVFSNMHHWGPLVFNFPWIFVVIYVILWIVIPPARSVEEKYAMRGAPLSARGVQHSAPSHAPRYRYESRSGHNEGNRGWYVLGRVVAVIVGLFFLVTSTAVLISLIVAFTATGFFLNVIPTALPDLVSITVNPFLFKLFLTLVLLIPVIGFIHLGSVLVFNIKGQKWIGPTLFFTWLVSFIGFLVLCSFNFGNFRHDARFQETVPLELTSDTLYVEFEADNDFLFERYWLEANNSHYNLGWLEGKREDLNLVFFPHLTLVRQSNEEIPSLLVKSRSFGSSEHRAELEAEATKPDFRLDGNVLTLNAVEVNREDPWRGNTGSLLLYLPSDQVVIVRKPVYHEFGVSRSRKVNIIRSE